MKKMMKLIIVACLTMVFVLAPVKYSFAAENSCPPHAYSATHEGYRHVFLSSHPYLIENGINGPDYGTCYIYHDYYGLYPRCVNCGNIDYSNPHWENDLGIRHTVNH